MPKLTSPSISSSRPRTLILSMRDLEYRVSRSYINEFENCICSWEEVDLLTIPYFTATLSKKIVNHLSKKYFQISGNSKIINPINNYFSLNEKYEIFFYICQDPLDLLYLNAIKNWRGQCSKAVCLLDAVWMKNYFKYPRQLSLLRKFDYIFMDLSSSLEAVAKITQKPCYYLAPGVDAVEFCPYPLPPQRSVDVCYFGDRSSSLHQSLLNLGERENFLYIYDTRKELFANNHQDHRAMYQNIVKRSKYFIAHKVRFNSIGLVMPQKSVTSFFEGTSGGAVILGTPPQTDTFTQHFDWSDAVINLPSDAINASEVITDLNLQPERLEQIRKNNVVNSLLRHDWVYRWGQILDVVGLSHTPKMAQRQAHLRSLADMALQKSS